jgi:hypothetical protein
MAQMPLSCTCPGQAMQGVGWGAGHSRFTSIGDTCPVLSGCGGPAGEQFIAGSPRVSAALPGFAARLKGRPGGSGRLSPGPRAPGAGSMSTEQAYMSWTRS